MVKLKDFVDPMVELCFNDNALSGVLFTEIFSSLFIEEEVVNRKQQLQQVVFQIINTNNVDFVLN